MTKNLWNLENYPASFCFDNPEVQEWRDVKNITSKNSNCANDCAENVVLTAQSVLEPNFDLGPYPQNDSDLNEENLWMSQICFEVSAPFNVLVLTSIDGNVRVKAIDYIMKGEHLRFKREPEQESAKLNWKWMVQPIKTMVLQTCAVVNCNCYHCKSNENGNYFRLKNIVNRKSQPTTNLNVWEKKIDINFNCAENYRNEIFRRISRNPFTINLNHELWVKTEQSCFKNQLDFPDFQPNHQSENSDEPTLDFDKEKPHEPVNEEFKCNVCGRVFLNSHRLKIHVTRMHRPKMHKYKKKTTRKSNTNRECNLCESNFHDAPSAKINPEATKGKNNPISCEERINLEVTTGQNIDTTCDECGKVVKRARGLFIHKHFHLIQRARDAGIHREIAIREDKQTKCGECGKIFKTGKGLNFHSCSLKI